MMSCIKFFRQYLATIKSEFREIETIQHAQWDKYLQEFFVGIRKETNEGECNAYHPGSLDGYQSMITDTSNNKNIPMIFYYQKSLSSHVTA